MYKEFPFIPSFNNGKKDIREEIYKSVYSDELSQNKKIRLESNSERIKIRTQFPKIKDQKYIHAIWYFFIKKYSESNQFNINFNEIMAKGDYESTLQILKKAAEDYDKVKNVEKEIDFEYNSLRQKIPIEKYEIVSEQLIFELKNITPVQLFDKLICENSIPFAALRWKGKYYYKANKINKPKPEWLQMNLETEAVMGFIIDCIGEGVKTKMETKRYQKCYLVENVDMTKDVKYKLIINYNTLFGLNNQGVNKIIEKYFNLVPSELTMVNSNISVKIEIKNFNYDKVSFADFITFHPNIRNMIFAEESHNSMISKAISSFYLVKELGKELLPLNSITTTFIQEGNSIFVYMKHVENLEMLKIYTERYNKILNIYHNNIQQLLQFYIDVLLLNNEPSIYDYIKRVKSKNTSMGIYNIDDRLKKIKNALGDGDENLGKKEYDRLFKARDDEVKFQYTSVCPIEKRPYIVNDETREEFEQAKNEYMNVIGRDEYTEEELKEIESTLELKWPETDNAKIYACIPRKTEAEQKYMYPHLTTKGQRPCCTTINGLEKREKDKSTNYSQMPILMKPNVPFGRRTMNLPFQFNKIIRILHHNHTLYNRHGLGTSLDTIFRAFMYLIPTNRNINEQLLDVQSNIVKTTFNIPIDEYLEPFIYAPILIPLFFKSDNKKAEINIIFFELLNNKSECELRFNTSSNTFNKNNLSLIIFYYIDTKTGHKICELISYNGEFLFTPNNKDNKEFIELLGDMIENGFNTHIIYDKLSYI